MIRNRSSFCTYFVLYAAREQNRLDESCSTVPLGQNHSGRKTFGRKWHIVWLYTSFSWKGSFGQTDHMAENVVWPNRSYVEIHHLAERSNGQKCRLAEQSLNTFHIHYYSTKLHFWSYVDIYVRMICLDKLHFLPNGPYCQTIVSAKWPFLSNDRFGPMFLPTVCRFRPKKFLLRIAGIKIIYSDLWVNNSILIITSDPIFHSGQFSIANNETVEFPVEWNLLQKFGQC